MFKVNEQIPTAGCVSHPYLPIIVPDYSFVMDLMDMKTILLNKFYKPDDNNLELNVIINQVAKVYSGTQAPNINHGYRWILSFINTTSRKVWMYPQKNKGADTTYESFKKFLKDVHSKVARLLSDADKVYVEIKKHNDFFTTVWSPLVTATIKHSVSSTDSPTPSIISSTAHSETL